MEGTAPPAVLNATFLICVSGHEKLKIMVFFTWEHQKVAVLGHFSSLFVIFLVAKLGFSKLELKPNFCDSYIL